MKLAGAPEQVTEIEDAGTRSGYRDCTCRLRLFAALITLPEQELYSIFGIYQSQAAMSALADWTNDTFEPWFTALLTRATGSQL